MNYWHAFLSECPVSAWWLNGLSRVVAGSTTCRKGTMVATTVAIRMQQLWQLYGDSFRIALRTIRTCSKRGEVWGRGCWYGGD